MFNTLLCLNYFPKAWKVGELVYFKKAGKPTNQESSYRPISLLPILGKIFEKLLLNRMNFHLLHNRTLSNRQHGFRELHSTETAILKVLNKIKINKANSLYTSPISIDFKGAFDNLYWSLSLNSLSRLNLPLQFQNLLSSFLKDRSIIVDWLTPSYKHLLWKGRPQGSCLGSFLWLSLLETLLSEDFGEGTEILAYADDVLLAVSGHSRRVLESTGNKVLQQIDQWSQKSKIEISTQKTQVITFGKPKRLLRPPIL